MCAVISRDRRTMRGKSHAGARPPCSGRLAEPVLTCPLSLRRDAILQAVPSSPRTPWITAALLLILSYGALLRLDAFTGKYGSLDHPAWARLATHQVAALARSVRPSAIAWYREPRPYVGGDPINYLNYARQMTSFYQAHVREPIFLAATRLGLWALGGQDS